MKQLILFRNQTDFFIIPPKTARYFISALKKCSHTYLLYIIFDTLNKSYIEKMATALILNNLN
ncbi:hypothetical protein A6574_25440 [Escherichia coli]|nr:hypothetical protein A8F92_22565 [Escherichia coli]RCP60151.1 hypothetical protein A6574_25440 [Escherichia coli]